MNTKLLRTTIWTAVAVLISGFTMLLLLVLSYVIPSFRGTQASFQDAWLFSLGTITFFVIVLLVAILVISRSRGAINGIGIWGQLMLFILIGVTLPQQIAGFVISVFDLELGPVFERALATISPLVAVLVMGGIWYLVYTQTFRYKTPKGFVYTVSKCTRRILMWLVCPLSEILLFLAWIYVAFFNTQIPVWAIDATVAVLLLSIVAWMVFKGRLRGLSETHAVKHRVFKDPGYLRRIAMDRKIHCCGTEVLKIDLRRDPPSSVPINTARKAWFIQSLSQVIIAVILLNIGEPLFASVEYFTFLRVAALACAIHLMLRAFLNMVLFLSSFFHAGRGIDYVVDLGLGEGLGRSIGASFKWAADVYAQWSSNLASRIFYPTEHIATELMLFSVFYCITGTFIAGSPLMAEVGLLIFLPIPSLIDYIVVYQVRAKNKPLKDFLGLSMLPIAHSVASWRMFFQMLSRAHPSTNMAPNLGDPNYIRNKGGFIVTVCSSVAALGFIVLSLSSILNPEVDFWVFLVKSAAILWAASLSIWIRVPGKKAWSQDL